MSTQKTSVANSVRKLGSIRKNMLWGRKMFDDLRATIRNWFSEGQIETISTTTLSATAVTELSTTPASASYYTGFIPSAPSNDIAAGAGGAISISRFYTTINSDAGGDAFSLADGVVKGQLKKIQLIVDGGGDAVITPSNLQGGTTITMADAGDFAILLWDGSDWYPIELGNAVDGISAPVIA